jgi:gamma-glutamyltranspeptidase / glutathione hydrolase
MKKLLRILGRIGMGIVTVAVALLIVYLVLPKGPRDPMKYSDPWHQPRQAVTATTEAAVTGTPWATDVAMKILDQGGNAFDAAAGALLALNVTHDEASSFPGIAPVMIYDAKTRRVLSYIGAGRAPMAATIERFTAKGYKTVPDLSTWSQLVPASPDVIVSLLRDYGTMSFEQVVAPAIALARDGFPVHHILQHNMDMSLVKRLGLSLLLPYNAQVYFGGQWWRPLHEGDRLKLPDLANTLDSLANAEKTAIANGGSRAEGLQAVRDYFYKGPIAKTIGDWEASRGGLMTAQDLADYTGGWETPIQGTYGDYTFFTNGTWSQGATGLLALQILDGVDLKTMGQNSPTYIHAVAQAIELAMADREAYMADPAFVKVPIAQIMSPAYASERRAKMTTRAFGPLPAPGVVTGLSAAPVVLGAETANPSTLLSDARMGKDTSHIAIVDRWGNAVSLTPSDFPKSPMVPGTGLTLGDRMTQFRLDPASVNALAPGKRPRVTPHAVIVFKDGKFSMAFGTPGDDMQPQALVQVFLNMAVFGMGIQDAIDAPRFRSMSVPASFAPHQSLPGTLLVEKSLADTSGAGLTALGYTVKELPDWDNTCGAVGAILTTGTGLVAGSDPREETWAEGK